MADIAMCEGTNCPIKEQCERFTAKPNEYRQSYFVTIPGKRGEDGKWECEMFWGQTNENVMKQLNDILNGDETDSSRMVG